MTRQQIQQAIDTFRKITIANTISPENVGVLLRALIDFATSTDEAAQAAAALISGYSLLAKAAHDSITITLRNDLGNVVGEGCKIPLANGSTNEAGLLGPREKEQIDDNRLDIVQLNTDLNEATHELYNYIDQSDQFITTDLTKKINAADTKAGSALQLAESLDGSRAEPDGLATLDEYGRLDPSQIDPDTIGVRIFNGFVEGVTIEEVGITDIPGFSSIVFDTKARKFLLQAGPKYYQAWPGTSKYNSPYTHEPHPERIYISTAQNGIWWWNGKKLIDMAAIKDIQTLGTVVESIRSTVGDLAASRGQQEGLATLGMDCKLEPGQLPTEAYSVRHFHGFVSGLDHGQMTETVKEPQEDTEVVFDTDHSCFLLRPAGSTDENDYWTWWPGAYDYMPSRQHRKPSPDRIYICRTSSGVWWWNGQELEDITANALIFQKIGRAATKTFDDLFLAAAGTWGRIDHTHKKEDGTPSPYYLNELWLTYEEAVAIYNAYVKTDSKCSTNYTGVNIRTNLPFGTSYITSLGQMFQGCKMEVIRVGCAATTSYAAFASCANARKIYGIIIDGSFPAAQDFSGCVKLETLEISRLKKSLILSDSPLLSAYSVNYIVTKAANTTAITITLHADVYNKIVEAAESDTESEWSGLLELAASKNITFASA